MPVDYSKWDKLDLSDDEGEATTSVAKAPGTSSRVRALPAIGGGAGSSADIRARA